MIEFVVLLALPAAFIAYAYWEARQVRVTRLTLPVAGLPPALADLTILHLSDVHLRGMGQREARTLALIEEIHPDLILITGDYSGGQRHLQKVPAFFSKLHAPYGVWGVLGNWEHRRKVDPQEARRVLAQTPLRLLVNESASVLLGEACLWLIGVDDPYTRHADLPRALRDVDGRRPRILLAHSPSIVTQLNDGQVDVILSGHTHGTQIRLPGFGPWHLRNRYDRRYVRGLHRIGSAWLYVSPGLGTTLLPLRFRVPPEITVVKLVEA